MKVSHLLSRSMLESGSESRVEVMVRFEGVKDETPRMPLNLALVLDRSGSMGGTPLKQAIKASQMLVDKLSEDDTLTIVTYDDTIRTILKPQKVGDKKAIKELLRKVRAGGITNLSGGWQEGCKHVTGAQGKGTINRVLLLTDGQANMGITSTPEMIKLAAAEGNKGVVTTTLGFGSYFNEDLLIGMADAAGGNFYFIQSPSDAAEVFGIEVDGLASVVGRDLTVTIEPAEGVTIEDVLNNYKFSSGPGGCEVQVGEVYGIEPKPLNLTLKVDGASANPAQLLKVSYKYNTGKDDDLVQESGSMDVAVATGSAEDAAAAPVSLEVVREASRLRIGKVKEEAVGLADKREFDKASEKLRAVITDLKTQALDEEFEIAEEIDQLDHYAKLFDKGQYSTAYRKEIKDQSYQARSRNRGDLKLRGVSAGNTTGLDAVTAAEGEEEGVVLTCIKQNGKLRVKVVSEGYDKSFNVQFPRAIRREGSRYLVEGIEVSKNGSFYRATGAIKLLLRPGEARPSAGGGRSRGALKKAAAKTWADVPTVTEVGDGVLIQIVKERKLRARVVSDGYDPNKNMRFPRSIRKEGVLFVVDEVRESSDGKYYIAYGKINRLVQDDDDDNS